MNKYFNDFKKLCTPAFFYFILSFISLLLIALQNLGNNKKYCIGMLECNVSNTIMIFAIKIIYVIFWTFILNALCKAGYSEISWFLVLLPFLLLFVLLGFFLLHNKAKIKK